MSNIGKPSKPAIPMPQKPGESLVVQSNPLVEARYRLPVLAQQLIRVLISMIQSTSSNIEEDVYQIDVPKFGKLIGRERISNLYNEIKVVAETLRRVPIFIKEKRGSVVTTSWISGYRYHDKKGYIDFSFSPHLKPYLIQLYREFTQYRLNNIVQLSSQYSIRIYELLRQYNGIGCRAIPLDELKVVLETVKGYLDYRDFRRRVLEVAHQDIITKTDLTYRWRPIKTGRKVTAIEFYDIVCKPVGMGIGVSRDSSIPSDTPSNLHAVQVPLGDMKTLITTIADQKSIRPKKRHKR